jgi:hypothetical protein
VQDCDGVLVVVEGRAEDIGGHPLRVDAVDEDGEYLSVEFEKWETVGTANESRNERSNDIHFLLLRYLALFGVPVQFDGALELDERGLTDHDVATLIIGKLHGGYAEIGLFLEGGELGGCLFELLGVGDEG